MSGPTPQQVTLTSNAAAVGCHTVLIDFLAAIDHGHATTAVDLFTDDASFAARGQQLQGRDAISWFLAEREAETERHTVHVVANEVARQITDNRVELDALIVLLVRQPTGYSIDRILDTTQVFSWTEAGWRIACRSTRPVDAAGGSPGPPAQIVTSALGSDKPNVGEL